MKTSFKMKISLLCIFVMISVVGISFLVLKSKDNDIKTFTEISKGMSKNLNQLNNTSGITLTGLASDPNEKLFKIGINMDMKKITPEQLKEIIESYLVTTSSFTSNKDWKSLLKPYNIRIEELSSGKLIAEKTLNSTEIIWFPFSTE